MRSSQCLWIFAAALHVSLVLCGAAHVVWSADVAPGCLLGQYGELSGAGSNYGFFAPSVAAQPRVAFTMEDAGGQVWHDTLFRDTSTVFGLRSATVLDEFAKLPAAIQRGLAGSWAGIMFRRHALAQKVGVRLEVQMLPTMAEWRAGRRVTWEPLYQGTFARKAGAHADATEVGR